MVHETADLSTAFCTLILEGLELIRRDISGIVSDVELRAEFAGGALGAAEEFEE